MGIPTRLHGDAVAIYFGAVKGFCPKCLSFREWKVIKEKGKFLKECQKCGKLKEIEEPELSKLKTEAKARHEREEVAKKEKRK